MPAHRPLLTTLAVAALAAAAPSTATAMPISPPARAATAGAAQRSITLSEHLKRAGIYEVTVAVKTDAATGEVVNLMIGTVTRHAVTAALTHRAKIEQRVSVSGRELVIHASAREAKPAISASVKRVGDLTTTGKTAGSGGSSGSTGPTGPTTTGATGSSGSAGSAAPSGSTGSSGSSGSSGPPPPTSGPPGNQSNWNLVFNDEFSSLNSAVWSPSRDDSGTISPGFNPQEQECFDPLETTVGGGEADFNLISKSESCGGNTEPYAGSILDTSGKWSYTYGYLEARIWMPGSNGVIADWPTFWAVGANWPTDGEIDIAEGLGGQACWHFHYGSPSSPQAQGNCVAGDYTGGWHTFGADWEPGSITWYYDGQDVGSVTSDVTNEPMGVILNLAIEPGDSGQVPAVMRVQYVRLYQHTT